MGTIPDMSDHHAVLGPRKVSITDDDKGPIVNIINWMCIVTTILAVLTRVGLRVTTAKRINRDDMAAVCGMIFAIAHTFTISSQVAHGLGRRQASLSPAELEMYQKTGYAAQFLFIFGCVASKLSTVILLFTLTPAKAWRLATKYFGYSIVVWGTVSVISIAFQCKPPETWRILNLQGECFNQNIFWSVIIIVDILQEAFMVLVPVLFVRGLHMTLSHKFVVIFAFAFRILVMVFSCFRLFYMLTLPSPTDSMSDITFHSMNIAIFTHLTLCTSLVVSCVPFLKSVMENLQSGLFANHGQHGLFANGGSGMSPSGSYAMKNLSKSGKSITKGSRNGTQVSQAGSVQNKVIKVKRAQPMLDDEEIDMGEGLRGRDERLLIEVMQSVEVTEGRQEDEESLNSLSGSERRILGRSHRTMVEAGRDVNPSRSGA